MTEANFGRETVGDTEVGIANGIHGSPFQIPHNGLAKHMTVFLGLQARVTQFACKCAIYHLNTGQQDTSGDLIAVTAEKDIPSIQDWWEFDFADEPLIKNEWYALVVWSKDVQRTMWTIGGGFGKKELLVYNGYPDPIAFGWVLRRYSIYCTYEIVEAVDPLFMGINI